MYYSRSPIVGNPIASILKSNAKGIPALFVLNPVSNFLWFTIGGSPPAQGSKSASWKISEIAKDAGFSKDRAEDATSREKVPSQQ